MALKLSALVFNSMGRVTFWVFCVGTNACFQVQRFEKSSHCAKRTSSGYRQSLSSRCQRRFHQPTCWVVVENNKINKYHYPDDCLFCFCWFVELLALLAEWALVALLPSWSSLFWVARLFLCKLIMIIFIFYLLYNLFHEISFLLFIYLLSIQFFKIKELIYIHKFSSWRCFVCSVLVQIPHCQCLLFQG